MDPLIWSRLPDDLLDRIFAILALLTLRPICKRFNSLLLSRSFLSLLTSSSSSSSSSSNPYILSHPQFSNRSLPLYFSSTNGWRTTRISSSSSSSHLLFSSSGLLLFSSLNTPSSLFVLNLLTNCSTSVPSSTSPISFATLVSLLSASPHGYKIFLSCPNSNWVFVYTSHNQS